MAKLGEFMEGKDFSGAGLPQGETVLDISKTTVEEKKTADGVRYMITSNGKEYGVPKSVMNDIQAKQEEGFNVVKINRSGTGITDTRYIITGEKE